MDFKENVIEFYSNEKSATVTFTQQKFINKIKKLAEEHPEDVQITFTNADGSIVAHIPVGYIKLNAPRKVTEEEKEAFKERMNKSLGR